MTSAWGFYTYLICANTSNKCPCWLIQGSYSSKFWSESSSTSILQVAKTLCIRADSQEPLLLTHVHISKSHALVHLTSLNDEVWMVVWIKYGDFFYKMLKCRSFTYMLAYKYQAKAGGSIFVKRRETCHSRRQACLSSKSPLCTLYVRSHRGTQ